MSKTYHVQHILVKHSYEADDILKKMTEGKSFEQLARQYSSCSSATNGGDLGVIKFGKADEDFENAVLQLQPGEITKKPIRSRFGFHIIKKIN